MLINNNPYPYVFVMLDSSHYKEDGTMYEDSISDELLIIAYESVIDHLVDRGIYDKTRLVTIKWWNEDTMLNHFHSASKYFFSQVNAPQQFIAQLGLNPSQYEIL